MVATGQTNPTVGLSPATDIAIPRQPRIDLPGIAQHIVRRGNNHQPCFNPADYQYPKGVRFTCYPRQRGSIRYNAA